MSRIETRYSDRAAQCWPPGPWDAEPDKVQWVDEATGLDCLIVRHPHFGHLCGYVGVPSGHPWHGREPCVAVHGGLSFCDHCHEGGLICHVPEPGRPADVWWLGFDCNQGGDGSPTWYRGGLYRTIAYVEAECRRLAEQAAERARA